MATTEVRRVLRVHPSALGVLTRDWLEAARDAVRLAGEAALQEVWRRHEPRRWRNGTFQPPYPRILGVVARGLGPPPLPTAAQRRSFDMPSWAVAASDAHLEARPLRATWRKSSASARVTFQISRKKPGVEKVDPGVV